MPQKKSFGQKKLNFMHGFKSAILAEWKNCQNGEQTLVWIKSKYIDDDLTPNFLTVLNFAVSKQESFTLELKIKSTQLSTCTHKCN